MLSLCALTRRRSDNQMIVNSPHCMRSQGSELMIVIELAPDSVHRPSRKTDFPVCVVWCLRGPCPRLVVSNLGTFAVPPPPLDRSPECHRLVSGASLQRFIRPAGFSALSPDYSLGMGSLTDRPWPRPSRGSGGREGDL